MRSKWMRYSSSSAARSPACARSTSFRTCSVDSRAFGVVPVSELLTLGTFPRSPGAEPDAGGAVVAAEIRDARDDDVVAPVLEVEDDDARPVGVERLLELVGAGGLDEAADHLAALEPDLDPYAICFSQRIPPPTGLRERTRDARRPPAARTCRAAAARRSARRLPPRAPRGRPTRRRPRTQRGPCPARASRGNGRPACRRRAQRAARPGSRRAAARPPRRPAPRPVRDARACRRRAARTPAPRRRDPRRRRRRDGWTGSPPRRCYRRFCHARGAWGGVSS